VCEVAIILESLLLGRGCLLASLGRGSFKLSLLLSPFNVFFWSSHAGSINNNILCVLFILIVSENLAEDVSLAFSKLFCGVKI